MDIGRLPDFTEKSDTHQEPDGTGMFVYTGVGQVAFVPFPEFDDTPMEFTADDGVMLRILSGSVPESRSPVLHDRLFPKRWCPGINLEHEQARGLVAAFPMWD